MSEPATAVTSDAVPIESFVAPVVTSDSTASVDLCNPQ